MDFAFFPLAYGASADDEARVLALNVLGVFIYAASVVC